MTRKVLYATIIILGIALACYLAYRHPSRTISRAFYYWKSVYSISPEEEKLLDTLHIQRLYVKYFDVEWNNETQQPVPVAIINFPTPPSSKRIIIPAIYITNKTLQNLNPENINGLADKIYNLIDNIDKKNKIIPTEIQFDCDWTESTRGRYFALITGVRKKFTNKILMSATIRLHQVKYADRTGVPPVDRGMLMFYNMGDLNNTTTPNSIFDEVQTKKYIRYVSKYSLPLDVALPIFTWGVHLRNNHVVSLVNNLKQSDTDTVKYFQQAKPGYYIANDGFFFRGDYFRQGDVLRMEEITPQLSTAAANMLSDELKREPLTVTLYHFDKSNTSRYNVTDFEKIYSSLR